MELEVVVKCCGGISVNQFIVMRLDDVGIEALACARTCEFCLRPYV